MFRVSGFRSTQFNSRDRSDTGKLLFFAVSKDLASLVNKQGGEQIWL